MLVSVCLFFMVLPFTFLLELFFVSQMYCRKSRAWLRGNLRAALIRYAVSRDSLNRAVEGFAIHAAASDIARKHKRDAYATRFVFFPTFCSNPFPDNSQKTTKATKIAKSESRRIAYGQDERTSPNQTQLREDKMATANINGPTQYLALTKWAERRELRNFRSSLRQRCFALRSV